MAHKVYLGLGSNLGDRLGYLEASLAALPPAARVLRRSPIYETEPWGYMDQPKFLNMVAEAETDLSPKELLKTLKDIEVQLGRKPTFRNGPRQIDMDILLYDNLVLDEDGLQIPHPNISKRAFVLVPLSDLAPELRLPGGKETVSQLREKIKENGLRRYTEKK